MMTNQSDVNCIVQTISLLAKTQAQLTVLEIMEASPKLGMSHIAEHHREVLEAQIASTEALLRTMIANHCVDRD